MRTEDATSACIKLVDALIRDFAKTGAAAMTADDAIEGAWELLEIGLLRLVTNEKCDLGLEINSNPAKCRAWAKKIKPLIEYRRAMLNAQ